MLNVFVHPERERRRTIIIYFKIRARGKDGNTRVMAHKREPQCLNECIGATGIGLSMPYRPRIHGFFEILGIPFGYFVPGLDTGPGHGVEPKVGEHG